MAYMIQGGIWSSVFAVPTAVVDQHIKMCSPISLKILLILLRNPGVPVDAQWIAQRLNLPLADICDGLGYWVETGLLTESDETAQAQQTSDNVVPVQHISSTSTSTPPMQPVFLQEAQNPKTGQRLVTISSRPNISREDVVELAQRDSSFASLLQEAQEVLGAPLTPTESKTLASLCAYDGFHPDVVLMLLQYCVSSGKKSMNFVDKIAASWLEKGISSHEQVEQEILRLTQEDQREKQIKKAFGIYNRGLTPREREYIPRWYALELAEPLLFLACERAVENTGKVSFAYADKILTSWKSKGISTIQAALEDLKNGSPKPSAQNKSAQTGESSIDMDRLHQMLHGQI